ncbi:MAG: SDR family oxidoreductase [Candidatus Lindowbacteria bacterium]|nr:SDR family oxidoreductase [Candidatus Lindowbacteria bacterium]
MFSLESNTAVVTGGASGIGLATVRRFAEAGANVVIADITDAAELAKEVGGLFIKTDVSKEEQVKALMDKTAETYGRIDALINNAGIGGSVNFIPSLSAEDFDQTYKVNLMGVVFGMKHAVDHMTNGGSIVNTASVAGLQGALTFATYCSSKHAVIGVTKTAALEFAPRGIRVNCVCPGAVDTPMLYEEGVETELAISKLMMPLGRLCQPEEVAALFHFLVADDCSFVSGQAICIDGGMTAGLGLGIVTRLMENL